MEPNLVERIEDAMRSSIRGMEHGHSEWEWYSALAEAAENIKADAEGMVERMESGE